MKPPLRRSGTSRTRRTILANLGLAATSLAASCGAAELALRAWGYRFSPVQFLKPENADDWRAFHMGGSDPRSSDTEPLTVFDSELLWRVDPGINPEINAQGYRGPLFPPARQPGEFRIIAVGDSNTLGPLRSNDHWPGFLDDLVQQDRQRRVRVTNAGVYGYTSFQGLRRFEQSLRHQPDLAFFSFGANDAQPVRTSDAAYAERVAWLRHWEWSRIGPPLAHLWLKLADSRASAAAATHRVPLVDYRSHLERFVDTARAAGVTPVLLTRPWVGRSDDPGHWMTHAPRYNEVTREVAAARGAAMIDVHAEFRERADLFADPMHFNRLGNRQMAELLLRHLEALGVVAEVPGFQPGPVLDLSRPDDRRPELGPGFWGFERLPDGSPGRWTREAAVITLGRERGERGLALDLTYQNPLEHSQARIEVNGRPLYDLQARRGRLRRTLGIESIPGRRIEVRFVVEPAYLPRDHEPTARDSRALGVFVHSVRLTEAALASGVDLAALDEDSPELGRGWWSAESWADGRTGRWTDRRADLVLERSGDEDRLAVDLSLLNPRNETAGSVEVESQVLFRFRRPNGRVRETLRLGAVGGRRLRIRFRVDTPHVPARHDEGSPDTRSLGLFVHSVRLEGGPGQSRTNSATREPSGQAHEVAGR
jgi:lysophospholipase L1-like esterase